MKEIGWQPLEDALINALNERSLSGRLITPDTRTAFNKYCTSPEHFYKIVIPAYYEQFLMSEVGELFVKYWYQLESSNRKVITSIIRESFLKEEVKKKFGPEYKLDSFFEHFHIELDSFTSLAKKQGIDLIVRSKSVANGVAWKVWLEQLFFAEILYELGFELTRPLTGGSEVIRWETTDDELITFSPGHKTHDKTIQQIYYLMQDKQLIIHPYESPFQLTLKK